MSEDTNTKSNARQRRRRSRYDRPRRSISWFMLLLGLALGVGGGLYYAWEVAPVAELDTAPWQLRDEHRNAYLAAITLHYGYDGDLDRTVNQLIDLRLSGPDPIQRVAAIACDLARSSYVQDNTGLRSVRAMMFFYQTQGKSGCADDLIPLDPVPQTQPTEMVVLPTPTPLLDPTKTPVPAGTQFPTPTDAPFVPTEPSPQAFSLVSGLPTFCDAELSGVIEVRVQNFNGEPLPGLPVRVSWAGGESTFYTGLKPERGPGYADFQMEEDISYVIEMPGLSDPVTRPIVAGACNLEGGGQAVTSYRLVFRGG
jgi:hypothetical protein